MKDVLSKHAAAKTAVVLSIPPATESRSSIVSSFDDSIEFARSMLPSPVAVPVHHCIGMDRTMTDQRSLRCPVGNSRRLMLAALYRR
jgi:hypothetical protein